LRGGDFLKMGSRSIGGAVVIAAAFKRNTDAVQSRLVSPFLNYSHFLNSPCVDQRNRYMNMNETTYHIPLFGKDGANE
jgi:hypothetical protein